MKAFKAKKLLANNHGMATFEALPMIVIFVMLVGYSLGLWGIVHSATLHSIGARQYAFETLRNRTNYVYHRDRGTDILHNKDIGYRYHAVTSQTAGGDNFKAPNVPITIGKKPVNTNLRNLNVASTELHTNGIFELDRRNQKVEFSHAWIMTGYGICLNPACGAVGN